MRKYWMVKTGKSFLFPCKTKTVGIFDSQEEAEAWMVENKELLDTHVYIEPVEKLTQNDLNDIMHTWTIVPIKAQ